MVDPISPELWFSFQRDVQDSDFNALLALLRGDGHDVAPLDRSEGGICFLVDGKDAGKDIRFYHDDDDNLHYKDGVFVGDVWKHYIGPDWIESNKLRVGGRNCGGIGSSFTPGELASIRAHVVTALGVAENIIRTEKRGVRPDDRREHVRRYFHFDKMDALEMWTIPSSRWPDVEEERLFKCWKCHKDKGVHEFEERNWHPDTAFENLLGRYALNGAVQWCRNCNFALSYVKWTANSAKRLRRDNTRAATP